MTDAISYWMWTGAACTIKLSTTEDGSPGPGFKRITAGEFARLDRNAARTAARKKAKTPPPGEG